jgi:predicted metal-binding protein
MHCQVNLCGNYRNNLMCPPFLPSLSENRLLINRYNFALLLQLHQSIPSKSKEETREIYINTVLKLNEMLIALERKAFVSGLRLALALGAGECKLCETCVVKDGKNQCRKPGSSRPSMEGMGIDVLQTCQAAGLAMDFKEGELTIAGLLLID